MHRLADVRRLDQLIVQARTLWPAEPDNLPAYDSWLTKAHGLVARLSGHRSALAALEQEALDTDEPLTHAGRTSAGDVVELSDFQWQYETQSELVRVLVRFAADDGLLSHVSARRAFADSVTAATLTDPDVAALWEAAVRSIADRVDCPLYDGLKIDPQLGLVPVGKDSRSGLWEFALLQSGDIPARDPETGELTIDAESSLVFILIPGGEALLGCQKTDPDAPNFDGSARPQDTPPHLELVGPFLFSKYEMSQDQWARFTGTNPSFYAPGTTHRLAPVTMLHPVEQISWDDAVHVLSSLALEFPTDVRWEYAARGGTSSVWWTGDDRSSLIGQVNIADRASDRAHVQSPDVHDWPEFDDGWPLHAPVNSLPPNPFGLHNVHGNVWECCRDVWKEYVTPELGLGPDDTAPGDTGRDRTRCGGSFYDKAWAARSACRVSRAPADRSGLIGVRPCRELRK